MYAILLNDSGKTNEIYKLLLENNYDVELSLTDDKYLLVKTIIDYNKNLNTIEKIAFYDSKVAAVLEIENNLNYEHPDIEIDIEKLEEFKKDLNLGIEFGKDNLKILYNIYKV